MDSRALKKLEDIRIRAERINTSLDGVDYEDFLASEDKVDALERNMEVIGEAAKEAFNLDPDLKNLPIEKNLREVMAGNNSRNTLAHSYNAVNHVDLYATAKEIVPQLERQSRAIIDKALGKPKAKARVKGKRTLSLKKQNQSENSNGR